MQATMRDSDRDIQKLHGESERQHATNRDSERHEVTPWDRRDSESHPATIRDTERNVATLLDQKDSERQPVTM